MNRRQEGVQSAPGTEISVVFIYAFVSSLQRGFVSRRRPAWSHRGSVPQSFCPRFGTVDVKIKVPSVENQTSRGIPCFTPGVGQGKVLCTSPAAPKSIPFEVPPFWFIRLCFPQILCRQ